MTDPEDRELIEACLSGQTEAFGKLVVRYQNRLFHTLRCMLGSREDAKDVTQEAFVLAFRKLHQFRHDSAFYSWLFRIAMNLAASLRRREHPMQSLADVTDGRAPFDPIDPHRDIRPSETAEVAEQQRLVWQALEQLEPDFRMVLVLKELEGLKYEEIAEIMGCPLGTVRSRLHRARSMLREKLSSVLDQH
ncbi:MAG TPA: sigma-70 family RNA polymerase sigma factor [Planctomycetaceae bacterium]|nr:sigma-70 family RNA polymerase sigma factor [Planctomycetaceae bacterium]